MKLYNEFQILRCDRIKRIGEGVLFVVHFSIPSEEVLFHNTDSFEFKCIGIYINTLYLFNNILHVYTLPIGLICIHAACFFVNSIISMVNNSDSITVRSDFNLPHDWSKVIEDCIISVYWGLHPVILQWL